MWSRILIIGVLIMSCIYFVYAKAARANSPEENRPELIQDLEQRIDKMAQDLSHCIQKNLS